MSGDLDRLWSRVQARLALAVDEPTYRMWLEPLHATELSRGRLLVQAPPQACRWIRDRFGNVLQASVELAVGPGTAVELTGDPGERLDAASAPPSSLATRERSSGGPLGNPKLTFDQFVIGDCNRLAHAAALAVAEMPAQAYNPLFICGPPGVGKTHLLNSVACLIAAHNPDLQIRCTTGETFTREFIGALGARSTELFKVRFRDADVLLVDDVHFLERKARTEEEFFHTFNALHDAGRQIVLTSDRAPADLRALEDRLRERFVCGLVADITPPDHATRVAILRMRAHHDRIALAEPDALEMIAERVRRNVRALEGALIRVVAYSSLTQRPLTRSLTREVLDSLYPRGGSEQRRHSIADIQAAACSFFDVSPQELVSASRVARLAWPRQVAMFLARELSGESLPAIGRSFGGRDHTTVLHACRRASARMAADEHARSSVEELCATLHASRS